MARGIDQRTKRREPRRLAALALAQILALAACSTNGPGASQPRTASTPVATITLPSPPSPTASDDAAKTAVLTAYSAFWKALPAASRLDEGPREELLGRYLMSPALGTVIRTLAAQTASRKGPYGVNLPRPEVAAIVSGTASVRDCQDSSHAGVEDRKTGRKLTVGVPRNPVRATLRRGDDGLWRIATIEYPGGSC